ncbi:MAG: Hsp20/alpha crystallin family protein [Bdellovibrionota bacterium]
MSNLPSLWRGGSFLGERRDPFRAMERMQSEMERMFENFWGGDMPMSLTEFSPAAFQLPYNVEEKGSHYLLTFDVPGFSKDDIKVEVLDNQLHITGERSEERGEKKGTRFESSYGAIEQWLTLPQNTKADSVEAHIENGVLRIAIEKTAASKAKEIKVSEGKAGIFSRLLERKDKAA